MTETKRLTNAELVDIRERVEKAKWVGHGVGELALSDVPRLLAEVERLRKLALELNDFYYEAETHLITETSMNVSVSLENEKEIYENTRKEILGEDDTE